MIRITNGPSVPLDDYILHMVLKRGRVISRPKSPLYVEAIDLSSEGPMKFKMSLVDASYITETYPEFETGLVATWRLFGTTGLLKLVKAFDHRTNLEKVKEFLLDSQSAPFILEKYKDILK
jgi:hypothetical protein